MKVQIFALFLLFIGLSFPVFSQDFEVPENVSLKTAQEIKEAEPTVIQAINWILTTPYVQNNEKRKSVNAYLLMWLTGTKTCTIQLTKEVLDMSAKNSEMLMVFMAGYAKYVLENQDNKSPLKGNLSGVNAVLDFYQKNSDTLQKDKAIEAILQKRTKGTLEAWVAEWGK